MYADGGLQRHDQAHLVSDRITTDLPALARQVAETAAQAPTIGSGDISTQHHQAQVSSISPPRIAVLASQHACLKLWSGPDIVDHAGRTGTCCADDYSRLRQCHRLSKSSLARSMLGS